MQDFETKWAKPRPTCRVRRSPPASWPASGSGWAWGNLIRSAAVRAGWARPPRPTPLETAKALGWGASDARARRRQKAILYCGARSCAKSVARCRRHGIRTRASWPTPKNRCTGERGRAAACSACRICDACAQRLRETTDLRRRETLIRSNLIFTCRRFARGVIALLVRGAKGQ